MQQSFGHYSNQGDFASFWQMKRQSLAILQSWKNAALESSLILASRFNKESSMTPMFLTVANRIIGFASRLSFG